MSGSAYILFVEGLHHDVTEPILHDKFADLNIASVKVLRDRTTNISRGTGYMNFYTSEEAGRALEEMNGTIIKGKPIRLSYSQRDKIAAAQSSGKGNIFVKNLNESTDEKAFRDKFSAFGTILSSKIATDADGKSKRFGFVQYEKEEDAQRAIDETHKTLFNDNEIHVEKHKRKGERGNATQLNEFNKTIYVGNLHLDVTEDKLKQHFEQFGTISSVTIRSKENSTLFAYITFSLKVDGEKAMEKMNGKKHLDLTYDDDYLYVAIYDGQAKRSLTSYCPPLPAAVQAMTRRPSQAPAPEIVSQIPDHNCAGTPIFSTETISQARGPNPADNLVFAPQAHGTNPAGNFVFPPQTIPQARGPNPAGNFVFPPQTIPQARGPNHAGNFVFAPQTIFRGDMTGNGSMYQSGPTPVMGYPTMGPPRGNIPIVRNATPDPYLAPPLPNPIPSFENLTWAPQQQQQEMFNRTRDHRREGRNRW